MPVKILGVLPLAGSGSRSGLYFHKSLAPIMVSGVPVPVVSFSIKRLRKVSSEILAILYAESEYHFPVAELDLKAIEKPERGELPSSIAAGGEEAKKIGFSHVAVSLPDTIWFPENAFEILVENLDETTDGILGLFYGDGRMLDEVASDEGKVINVHLHAKQTDQHFIVWGWGILILSVEAAAKLDDLSPLANQLSNLKLDCIKFENSEFLDIGTPERYFDVFGRFNS